MRRSSALKYRPLAFWPTSVFYKITAKASSGSGLPAALPVGYCFYNKPAKTLVEGDKVKKVTLTKLTFARDDEDSSSREKFDKHGTDRRREELRYREVDREIGIDQRVLRYRLGSPEKDREPLQRDYRG
jgi:hypothetical protein